MQSKSNADLLEWFDSLDITWKRLLKREIDINRKPTLIDLQSIANLETIDVSNSLIISLDPVNNLTKLKSINFSHTKVKNVTKLLRCPDLVEIDASYTEISDITPLINLSKLARIDVSFTKIQKIVGFRSDVQIIAWPTPYEFEINNTGMRDKWDPLLYDATLYFQLVNRISANELSRKFAIGFNRAGRIIDQLEELKVVSPINDNSFRNLLVSEISSEEDLFSSERRTIRNLSPPELITENQPGFLKSIWESILRIFK